MSDGKQAFRIRAAVPSDAEALIRLDDPDRPVYRTDFVADGSRVYLLVSEFGSSVWRIGIEGTERERR